MTKYIKGKDGKFAGSIGVGKNRVPQAITRPHAVIDAADLMSALNNSSGSSVRLSDVALDKETQRKTPTYSETTYLDGVSQEYYGSYDTTCYLVTEQILARLRTSSTESFRDDVVKMKPIETNGFANELSFPISTNGDFTATINCAPAYGTAYIAVETRGGQAASEELPQEYTDVILTEIRARSFRR
jgi:hypothetical protein